MDNEFEPLGKCDVVSTDSSHTLMPHCTFKVGEFIAKMKQVFSEYDELQEKWLGDGQTCEVLRPGTQGWQKGKVRISLEFSSDDKESPLDKIDIDEIAQDFDDTTPAHQ
ncbi:MAG: KGK domain-containing protein [Cyanobacteria bacterium P01_A01_bin.45]